MATDRTFIATEVDAYDEASQVEATIAHDLAHPDDLWAQLKLLLPPEKPPRTPGRPVVPFRQVVDGILYVLRAGCQWKALPKEYGSGSTCHRRFQTWVEAGSFERPWASPVR